MVQAEVAQPEAGSGASHSRRLAVGVVVSVSAFMALCAKKAGQVSKKVAHQAHDRCKFSPRSIAAGAAGSASPLRRPKKLLSNISDKAIAFVHKGKKVPSRLRRRRSRSGSGGGGEEEESEADSEEFGFGDGGVWQRSILMGDKCQPLDFSGVIYYDEYGKKLEQPPLRSPRASPMPGYLARTRPRASPEERRVSKFDFGGLGK
ncbi:hypothetical protein BT93_L5671 [Corymbia citriodora subsp. variegata]|uniref:Uncharacterized protein n=1 Tax=Corymbia citriodora subsp. variegata TaxID=360336 RepID=A0A8T0CVT2_CORYI|nr:hypothetical protein BT93_L5671 [Corymbia citriodora subsp. variegata]